ncbi:MAG: hypothetical protein K6F68_04655 [Clostridiales bacterium]|nr:hypothetical protein [Clostridiales bacterium]
MRRLLAILGLILAIGGFVLLALSVLLNIHFLIPVGMILGAFLLLLAVKKMPSDLEQFGENKPENGELPDEKGRDEE